MSGVTHLAISAAVYSHNVTPFYFHARRSTFSPDLLMIVTNIKENTWFVGVQFPLIYVSLKWLGDLFGNNQMQIYAPCAPCHGSFGNICRLSSSSLKRMSALENQMTHSSSFCSNLNDCVWKQDQIVLAKSCFGNFLSRRDELDWIVGRSTRRT